VFHFVFSELQQVLPYLPDEHSNKEGNYYGRITQPVVNFLLAKLALNAEIYMYNDWAQGGDIGPLDGWQPEIPLMLIEQGKQQGGSINRKAGT
jgi:hypothetical protein